jgi:zinc protease
MIALAAASLLAATLVQAADPAPASASVASAAAQIRLPVPELETLPNGLTVAWFTSDAIPVVDLELLVRSGYRDDPAGKSGTAELVAATLDRGAGGMSEQAIGHAVEMLGATRFATADDDTFSVGMHGLAPDAPKLLELMAKIVIHPEFPVAEVQREHDRIIDRWNHLGDYGDMLASVAYRRILASGTVYGRASFAGEKEFAHVGREDAIAFHLAHFTPRNSVLVVVGRFDRAQFRAAILAAMGTTQAWSGEIPSHAKKTYADQRLPRKPGTIIVVDRPNLTQAQVRLGFEAPPINAPEHYPLVVANALLGEYFNSRLNTLIRDKLSLTYGIASGFSFSRDFSSLTISSSTRNEMAGQLVRETMNVLEGLRAEPVPADEVSMAREYLVGGFPLSTSTLGAVASRWLAGYIYDLGPGYLNEFVRKVSEVTPEEVTAAVKRDFDLSRAVIVLAGNAKEIEKSLASSKFTRIRRVSARDLE